MSEATTPPKIDLSNKECALIEQMHRTLEQCSHYTLLGISEDADATDVRKAYYDLSRHLHPDRFFRREVGDYAPKIEAIFSAITIAYQTLSDERKRDRYDQEALESRTPSRRRRRRRSVKAEEPLIAAGADPSDDDDGLSEEAAEAPPAPKPARTSRRSSRRARQLSPRARSLYRKKIMGKVRQEVTENIRRAKVYYEAGKKDLEDGHPLKAESSLYLAVKLDPRNEDYRSLLDEAHDQSLQIRAQQFMNAAESAESYQNIQEALYNYRKAVEYKSRNGQVYYRLAQLTRRFEKDTREALTLLRSAVQYSPNNADFRIALAEVYAELDLGLNARREYQEAGKHTKDKDTRERIKEGLRAIR
ncbi:MAG: DnaJ domain-containing protein [Myxococcota bacterium]|nr:DnaJ domain-containing protein [Myxococcota bacterium]